MDVLHSCSPSPTCSCSKLHVNIWAAGPLLTSSRTGSCLELHVSGGHRLPPACYHSSELHLDIWEAGPLSISSETRRLLEHHVQQLQRQLQWGLPRRVQESWRLLASAAPSGGTRTPCTTRPGPPASRPSSLTAQSPAALRTRWGPDDLVPEQKDQLWSHAGKYVEVRLGKQSAPASRSQRAAAEQKRSLAGWIHAGQKPPQPRGGFLLLLPSAAMDKLDRNLRQKHLAFLCGLSQHYLEPWAAAPPAALAFQGTEASFLAAAQWEALEQHVLRRRLQHTWGLPGTVQRSLWAFLPLAPAHPELPRLPALGLDVRPLLHDLPFLSKQVQSDLEAHVRRLVLQQKWGIPKKVGRSVRRFVASMPRTRESIISATGMPGPPVGHEAHGIAQEWLQGMMPEAPAVLLLHAAPATSRGLSQYGPVQLSPVQDSEKSERTMHKMKLVPVRLGRTPAAMAMALGTAGGLQGGAAWECLEAHITKKKLQHTWGLPALVQRSLGAFAAPPPSSTPRPQQQLPALVGVSMAVRQPRFLSTEAWQHLEAHVRRQVAERRWGLPRRIQESLRRLQLPGSAESRAPTEPQLHFICEEAPETPALDRGQRGLPPSVSREPPAQHWHELQISCCCEVGSLQPAEEPEGAGSSSSSQETSQPSTGEEPPGPQSGSCQAQEPRTWQGEQQSCHDPAHGGGSSGKGGSGSSCTSPEGCDREWVSVELDSSLRKRAEEHSQGATHLAQQALGSFLLLPDVTCCQGLCTEMEAECARDAAHEGQDQLHGGEARKSEPSGHWHTAPPNVPGPPGQTASCMSGCRQEPWAVGLVQETLTREPRSPACSGVHVTHCSLSAAREDIPVGSSIPAHSEGMPGTERAWSESQGDEEMPGYGEEPNASPPPSEFSTECEWERVGDWDREEMDVWGLKGKAGPAGVELSPASEESNTEETLELADAPSRDPCFEQMTVIGLILEKRLHLRHGLYYWQQSRERRSAVCTQAAGGGAAGIAQQ